jgi:hypothetical protein
MGKAKTKLMKARNEIFSEIIKKYDKEIDEGYIDDDNIDDDNKITDLAYDIRQTMFDYVNGVAYPLCEYLDIDSIINYLEWVLDQHI